MDQPSANSVTDLRPAITLSDVLPPDTVVSARPHHQMMAWLSLPFKAAEMLSAAPITWCGEHALVVHEACVTPRVVELLRRSGHLISGEAIVYSDESSFVGCLREIFLRGSKILSNHAPDSRILPKDAYLVPPETLILLNNKANLGSYVPEANTVPRRFIPCYENGLPEWLQAPTVLKGATVYSTGAGNCVAIARDATELADAWELMCARADVLDGIVAEDLLEFSHTWCVQVAITKDSVTYLGAAEQICDNGHWVGNYCGTGHEAPNDVQSLALDISEKGRNAGYCGIAGFDMGIFNGKLLVFDLNFRACGSTPQLLLHASACSRVGGSVTRSFKCESAEPFEHAVSRVGAILDAGSFVPTSAFDGNAEHEVSSVIAGFVVGRDDQELVEIEGELQGRLDAICC